MDAGGRATQGDKAEDAEALSKRAGIVALFNENEREI
ncbi:hypothetical protein MNBD_GAMMA16-773 [hydrothermal vent metagenome]|uniref:Uncharacterized protein n=1 Tax=hydrothermal vent metagenome TaxID=652676 RepID=A0A3B0ZCJ3_9ZZZZ